MNTMQSAKSEVQSVRNVVSQAQPVPSKLSIFNFQFSILILAFASFVCAGPIREGNKLYAKGDYAAALEKYTAARSIEKDSALVRFNIGTALYKNGKFAEAVQELTPLIGMADSSVSAQAAYNAANARFRLGEQAQGGERISAWREALGLLKRALDFNPDYLNAKKNAEIISRRLKAEIAQQKNQKKDGEDGKQPPLSEAAKRAKERALQLTREGRYAEAKAVLEKVLQAEPEATALSPYIQRLTDVLDITAGKKPLAPPDASNAVNELEVI